MSAHEDAEVCTASDAIDIVRKELKKTTPFADLSIITQAKCEEKLCKVVVRILEYDKNLNFKVSEKAFSVDRRTRKVVDIEEL